MKKFFLSLFLFAGITALSQPGDTIKKRPGRGKLIPDISTVQKLKKLQDSAVNAIPVPAYHQTEEDMSRNINGILQLQKEQKARQKKAAMVRIGIGLGFLVILVIGLSRRRRKAGESTLQLSSKEDSKTQP